MIDIVYLYAVVSVHAAHAAHAAHDAYTFCVSYERAREPFSKVVVMRLAGPAPSPILQNSRPPELEPCWNRITPLGDDPWPSWSLLYILMLLLMLHAAVGADAAHDACTFCVSCGSTLRSE